MTFGRRGPNISQFLRELHENPTVIDGDQFPQMDDQDLSMFTNTEFFDLETGQNTDFQAPLVRPAKPEIESSSPSDGVSPSEVVSPITESSNTAMTDFASLDFMAAGDFNFPDFGTSYPSPSIPSYSENLGNLQPIQPGPQQVYQSPSPVGQHGNYGPGPRIAAAEKRKSDVLGASSRAMNFEEQTRVAAEEDKRRRNTAASARFRVKKKQREQALEKSAKEMTEKVTALEGRIQQLETENKWLKGIVLEKNAGNEEFLGKLLEDFKAKHANADSRNGGAVNGPISIGVSDEENETRDSSG